MLCIHGKIDNLNMAHKFIHDIDVATVLGDIEYIIKLLDTSREKSPTLCSFNCKFIK